MNYKLELVIVPVTDVDRAKAFYADTCGFTLDVDHRPSDDFRVVKIDPPRLGLLAHHRDRAVGCDPRLLPRHDPGGHRHRRGA